MVKISSVQSQNFVVEHIFAAKYNYFKTLTTIKLKILIFFVRTGTIKLYFDDQDWLWVVFSVSGIWPSMRQRSAKTICIKLLFELYIVLSQSVNFQNNKEILKKNIGRAIFSKSLHSCRTN